MKMMKRDKCAVLSLVLKDKWFDMIALGQKKEEYRARGGYWDTRIRNWFDRAEEADVPLVVEFRRGYAARAQRTAFMLDSLLIRMLNRFLHPDWGEPQGEHYVLCLGERVKMVESPAEAARRPAEGPGEAGSHIPPSQGGEGLHGAPTGIPGGDLDKEGEKA